MRLATLAISVVTALALASPRSALADNQSVDVTVLAQPNSPITIDHCAIEWWHSTVFLNGSNLQGLYILTGVSFTNTSQQDITAIKFGFAFLDAFGASVGEVTGTNTGLYSPGILIQPKLGGLANVLQAGSPGVFSATIQGSSLDGLKCGVVEARYADGTIWKATDVPAATPSPSPSPFPAVVAKSNLWLGAGTYVNEITNHHPTYCSKISPIELFAWSSAKCARARAEWVRIYGGI